MFRAKHHPDASPTNPKGEMPGFSVFLRDGDSIFHSYSTYQRGVDLFMNMYNLLDIMPLGRQEEPGQRWRGYVIMTSMRRKLRQAVIARDEALSDR